MGHKTSEVTEEMKRIPYQVVSGDNDTARVKINDRNYTPQEISAIVLQKSELGLQVVDVDMGEEVRSVNTLSGGESFLVSLGLALGLSSLASEATRVESLFIDEGFGNLDLGSLDTALATLDALQASGRQVGIVSHVAGIAERIGAQVRVEPIGPGRSRVVTEGSGAQSRLLQAGH
jgi:DNA repair exonuclease SbcCD ATPase subunit